MQLVAYPLAVPGRPARQRTRLDLLRTDFTLGTCSPAPFPRRPGPPLDDLLVRHEGRVDTVRFLFFLFCLAGVAHERRCSDQVTQSLIVPSLEPALGWVTTHRDRSVPVALPWRRHSGMSPHRSGQ